MSDVAARLEPSCGHPPALACNDTKSSLPNQMTQHYARIVIGSSGILYLSLGTRGFGNCVLSLRPNDLSAKTLTVGGETIAYDVSPDSGSLLCVTMERNEPSLAVMTGSRLRTVSIAEAGSIGASAYLGVRDQALVAVYSSTRSYSLGGRIVSAADLLSIDLATGESKRVTSKTYDAVQDVCVIDRSHIAYLAKEAAPFSVHLQHRTTGGSWGRETDTGVSSWGMWPGEPGELWLARMRGKVYWLDMYMLRGMSLIESGRSVRVGYIWSAAYSRAERSFYIVGGHPGGSPMDLCKVSTESGTLSIVLSEEQLFGLLDDAHSH